jgi:CRISPR/Cas system type I-B associated protein Csh2 (Cas7 group RAMP superfamily)
MQVHDELVFDFPKSAVHPKEAKNSKAIAKRARSNWWRIKRLADLMAQGGQDLIPVVPTPVSIEYHPVSWDKGIKL